MNRFVSHQNEENMQKNNVLARILALLMGATRPESARAMVGLRMRLCPIWRASRTLGQRNMANFFMGNAHEREFAPEL